MDWMKYMMNNEVQKKLKKMMEQKQDMW